jgi:tRNA nucleotidyltransferase (CCA-adding enzyme)
MTLEEEVLGRITPDHLARQQIQHAVSSLMELVRNKADEEGLDLQAQLVGSVAKDTFLCDPDIDVFVLFPPTVPRKEMETVGLRLGRSILLDGQEKYAEHPYIHGKWQGMEVDLVPCYRIQDPSQLKSAVDRTPFHTTYIRTHLKEEQKGEVRLLKKFMKGIGTYGAEAKVQGFSGYLIELLILRYGTFKDAAKEAAAWKSGEVLAQEENGGKRFSDPLVFYDPVDPNRNVASALSIDAFARFIFAARRYLDSPSEKFFFPSPREPLSEEDIRETLRTRGTFAIIASIDQRPLIDDNLYPQVRKNLDGMTDLLTAHGFGVVDRGYHIGGAISLIAELESGSLPKAERHVGPPAWIDNASSFLEKWTGRGISPPFLNNGHWVAIVPRGYPSAVDLVREKLSSAALGNDLRDLRGLDVKGGDEVIAPEYRDQLSAMLDKRWPWDIQ